MRPTALLTFALSTRIQATSLRTQGSHDTHSNIEFDEPTDLQLYGDPKTNAPGKTDESGDVDLAQKISNPVADLISVPFHLWSFARDDDRKGINSTFLQPFPAHNFKTATTITINTESSHDWIDNQWTVPPFAGVGQIIKFGKLPVQFTLGGQYWVEGTHSAPDWSLRFAMTFLFLK